MKFIKTLLLSVLLTVSAYSTAQAEVFDGFFPYEWVDQNNDNNAAYAVNMAFNVLYANGDLQSSITPTNYINDIWLSGTASPKQIVDELAYWGITAHTLTFQQNTKMLAGDLLLTTDYNGNPTWGTFLAPESGQVSDSLRYGVAYYLPQDGSSWVGEYPQFYGSTGVRITSW